MNSYNSSMALRNQRSGYHLNSQTMRTGRTEAVAGQYANSARESLLYIVIVIIVIALSVAVITGYALITEANYQLQKITKEVEVLVQTNTDLQFEISKLRQPERILGIAQHELGMTLNDDRIIVLSAH